MNEKTGKRLTFLRRFLGPLLEPKWAFIVLVGSIAAAVFLRWTEVAVTARLQRNSAVAALLAVEIKHEASLDLARAREMHARLIKTTMARMQDPATKVVGFLNSKYAPEAQLMPVINLLSAHESGHENCATQDREALQLAQVRLAAVSKAWTRGVNRGGSLSIRAYDSGARIKTAEEFLRTFTESRARFAKQPTPERAETACMDSRFATAMVVTAWTDYDRQRRNAISKQFAADLTLLQDEILDLAKTLPADEENASLLRLFAKNIGSRSSFLVTLNSGGIPAARSQLLVELAQR